jgi:hypothetical protein
MLTREWLLEQLKMYKDQKDNALALANANQGALEAIESALKEFDYVEPEKEKLPKRKNK